MLEITDSLVSTLASGRYPDAGDLRARLEAHVAGKSKEHAVLTALRLESEDRFWTAVRAILEAREWTPTPDRGRVDPALELLAHMRHSVTERACDHFRYGDLLAACWWVEQPDAAFAFDLVRAIEAGDPEAAARVRERAAPTHLAHWAFSPSGSPTGRLRLYALQAARFEGDLDGELRWLVGELGHGAFVGVGAQAIADRLGATVSDPPPLLQRSSSAAGAMLMEVAYALRPDLALELVPELVKDAYLDGQAHALHALPWEERRDVRDAAQLLSAWQIGSLGLTIAAKLDDDGMRRGTPRLSAKVHKDADRARADLDKKLAKQAHKLGVDVQPWSPAKSVRDREAALYEAARRGSRLDVIELLAAGADPNGHRDMDRATALHQCVASAAGCALRLLRGGADPNAETAQGDRPLDLTSSSDPNAEVALRGLIDAGGQPGSLRDRLLEWDAQGGHAALVAMHREVGCDPSVPAKDGRTPAEIAEARQHWKTHAALLS